MGGRTAALFLVGAALWSWAAVGVAQETSPPALELYIFHNPSCPKCRKIIALAEELQRQTPALRVHAEDETKPGSAEKARELKKQTKVAAEAWGPSRAVFIGDGWLTEEGRSLIRQLHVILMDRAEVEPMEWVSDSLTEVSKQRSRVHILSNLGALNAPLLLRSGLQGSLRFPWLTGLLFLVGLLAATARSSGRALATGLGFCAGLLAAHTLGGLGKLGFVELQKSHLWVSLVLHGGLGVAALVLALIRLGHYRRQVRSKPLTAFAPPKQSPNEAENQPLLPAYGDRAGEYASRRRLAGQGFLAGLVLCALTVMIMPPAHLPVLAEAWRLGELPGVVLGLLGVHLLAVAIPVLLVTLVAYGLAASPRIRSWAQQHRAEATMSGLLLYLVMGAFLLAYAALLLVNFLAA